MTTTEKLTPEQPITPQQKAKLLVDAMHYHIEFYHMRGSAIECAKVAVDEILKLLPEGSIDYGVQADRAFYTLVKEEFETNEIYNP